MMQNSKYTVLMSVYYKEKPEYLSLSIESMLNQTVKPDEFIIVKDGPLTTELDEVINNFVTAYPKTFNIIVNETNLGLGPALAKGIENSKNELIARMDSDDYVVSTRCERQLEKFREDPKLGMVGSYEAEFVDDIDNVISMFIVRYIDVNKTVHMKIRKPIIIGSVLIGGMLIGTYYCGNRMIQFAALCITAVYAVLTNVDMLKSGVNLVKSRLGK